MAVQLELEAPPPGLALQLTASEPENTNVKSERGTRRKCQCSASLASASKRRQLTLSLPVIPAPGATSLSLSAVYARAAAKPVRAPAVSDRVGPQPVATLVCKRLRIGKLNAKIGRMCIFVACAGACTSGQNATAEEVAAHAGCTSKYRQREKFAIVLLGSVALYRKQNRDCSGFKRGQGSGE